MIRVPLLLAAAALLCAAAAGCTTAAPPAGADHEASFQGTWAAYLRCTMGRDLELLLPELDRLRREARQRTAPTIQAPSVVAAFVSAPPLRLAVDPGAMAAACALHAGEVASSGGRIRVATALWLAIVESYRDERYASYVARARAALTLVAAQPMVEQDEPLLASLHP